MRLAALVVLAGVLGGCDRAPPEPAPQEREAPSPNASILPAPLASAPPPATPKPPAVARPAASAATLKAGAIASTSLLVDAGRPASSVYVELPAAEPLRPDIGLPLDTVGPRDTAGLLLLADWRWLDAPTPPRLPEVFSEGLASARRLASFKWMITATDAGRMRVLFDTRAFPLPLGSELRARVDRLGHIVVFPGGNEYRSAAPGALRSLFGDRRLDVLPLVQGELTPRGAAPTRFGMPVRRVELQAKLGSVTLDMAHLPEPSLGAALLCRALLDLVAVEPTSQLCAPGELPLRAQFSWRSGSGVLFEVQDYARRSELPVGDIACPPLGAQVASSVLPPQPSGVLLTRDEATAFRQRPVDVGPPGPGAPPDGVLARNATDGMRYLLIDGVPVAWVLPGQELSVVGFPRGRYVAQWRSFLGDAVEPARQVELPARLAVGEPAPEPVPPPARSAR